MYSNQYTIDNLIRRKEEIENMIHNFQNPQPVNNFFNTSQTPSKTLIEWRILNENEEVDNLYVANKTLFINENTMVIKDVDGKLEKWEVKKIYPIDQKDKRINELENEVKKLKEMINNEPTKSDEPIRKFEQSDDDVDEYVKSKSKTNSKSISKQE